MSDFMWPPENAHFVKIKHCLMDLIFNIAMKNFLYKNGVSYGTLIWKVLMYMTLRWSRND